jgi:hypothetical protein
MRDEKWKDHLRSYFENLRIIEKSKSDTLENFNQFCEFIAEPAFEALEQELKSYSIKVRLQKSRGRFIGIKINFPKSKVGNFHYTIWLPKNSVELKLRLKIKGRRNRKDALLEREEAFMSGKTPYDIMKLSKEDLIQDIIDHYRDFLYEALTSPE